jgi:hypothetical protein
MSWLKPRPTRIIHGYWESWRGSKEQIPRCARDDKVGDPGTNVTVLMAKYARLKSANAKIISLTADRQASLGSLPL